MNATILFLKGIGIGFLVSIPVGPIAVLCIQRTMSKGRIYGIATGIGAAVADMVYSLIAACGLTVVASFLDREKLKIKLIGGIILCVFGLVKIFLTRQVQQVENKNSNGILTSYVSGFLLTLANPLNVLLFMSLFTTMELSGTAKHYLSAVMLVTGVFVGGSLWWLIVNGLSSMFFEKLIQQHHLEWLDKIAGIIILAFGVLMLLSMLHVTG